MDQFNDPVMHSLSDNITHQRTGSGCKCPGKTAKESKDISHGIGNSQISCTMMFDQDIEKFPADDTDGMLCDQRRRLL